MKRLLGSGLLGATRRSLLATASRSFGPIEFDQLYVPDHGDLLIDRKPPAGPGAPKRVSKGKRADAVAVPAARDAANLMEAAKVARIAGRVLIVLCSRECLRDDVRLQIGALDPRVPVLLVDMEGYVFPHRSQTLQQIKRKGRTSDTAIKRNAALLLARCLGLQHVLFLDDDVRKVDAGQVKAAVEAIESGRFRAAGWRFADYPDNSAVSHAYRRLSEPPYGKQGCFIGGGGLLVRMDDDVPHFPLGIYNEDWLFLFPLLIGREVKNLGLLKQLQYDPFGDPRNAWTQELGDLIGESLFDLLARRRPEERDALVQTMTSVAFWRQELRRRRKFLELLTERLEADNKPAEKLPPPAKMKRRHPKSVLTAVEAAARASGEIRPRQVRAWIRAWLADERCWRRLWRRARPAEGTLPVAQWSRQYLDDQLRAKLVEVGLQGRVHVIWPRLPQPLTEAETEVSEPSTVWPSSAPPGRLKGLRIPGSRREISPAKARTREPG